MVPAAYLVIKRRARQKKRHKGAFLGYEADDEDNVEGVSFGRGKAGRTINDTDTDTDMDIDTDTDTDMDTDTDTGKPQKIKEENQEWERIGEPETTRESDEGHTEKKWERSGEPETIRESDEGDMEKKWERSGEPQKNRESDEENMEEEWERTGDKLRRPRRWTT